MLLSDGSVTRHLQLLTGFPVQVVRDAGASQHQHTASLHILHACIGTDIIPDTVGSCTLTHLTLNLSPQDCFEMRNVGSSTEGLPQGVEAIPGPRTQRQVTHLVSQQQQTVRMPFTTGNLPSRALPQVLHFEWVCFMAFGSKLSKQVHFAIVALRRIRYHYTCSHYCSLSLLCFSLDAYSYAFYQQAECFQMQQHFCRNCPLCFDCHSPRYSTAQL